ncbi:MAG: hypothetical protein ABI615_02055 [Chthoniobacterales bacterium]
MLYKILPLFTFLCLLCAPSQGMAVEKVDDSTTLARQYIDFALTACDKTEKNLPAITKIAEVLAKRYIAGGNFIPLYNDGKFPGQGTVYEVECRSGGVMFRGAKPGEINPQNFGIMGWQRDPSPKDLEILQKQREKGLYVVGFGPKGLPSLAEHVKLCDAWLDTGFGSNDSVLAIFKGRAGRANNLVNILNSWALMTEFVAACTREGKMPFMYLSVVHRGNDWNKNHLNQGDGFHDDLKIAPIPAGVLARRYLDTIRELIKRFADTQLPVVEKAADLIAAETFAGRRTVVAYLGHSFNNSVGVAEDKVWADYIDFFNFYGYANPSSMLQYVKKTPNDALVLRVDHTGMHFNDWCVYVGKNQRVIHLSGPNDPKIRPDMQPPKDWPLVSIDMGYEFGDAIVSIEGYPFKVFPASGVMQTVAYECINIEALNRLHKLEAAKADSAPAK